MTDMLNPHWLPVNTANLEVVDDQLQQKHGTDGSGGHFQPDLIEVDDDLLTAGVFNVGFIPVHRVVQVYIKGTDGRLSRLMTPEVDYTLVRTSALPDAPFRRIVFDSTKTAGSSAIPHPDDRAPSEGLEALLEVGEAFYIIYSR